MFLFPHLTPVATTAARMPRSRTFAQHALCGVSGDTGGRFWPPVSADIRQPGSTTRSPRPPCGVKKHPVGD